MDRTPIPSGTPRSPSSGSSGALDQDKPPASVSISEAALAVWSSPIAAGLISAAVYMSFRLLTFPNPFEQSQYPYFVSLGDAFLHGRLDLQTPPNVAYDLSLFA
ncbi:MAG: hypothetical protein M1582_00325, partial [Actinobacteria bacterium]|nr:hypothetical protein [Actinomycetota bacterium]